MSNDIAYYEECQSMDDAEALLEELLSDYPEDEGWHHDYMFDIRHDHVSLHFEAWRGE